MSTSSDDDAEEELLLLYILMSAKRKKRKILQAMKREQQARAQRHRNYEENVEEEPIPQEDQEDPLSLNTMDCDCAESKRLETLKWVLATDNIKQENESHSQEIEQETDSENIQVKVEQIVEENVDNAYGEASVGMNNVSTNTDDNLNMVFFIQDSFGNVYIKQETTG